MLNFSKFKPDGKGGYDYYDEWKVSDEFMDGIGGRIFAGVGAAVFLSILISPICMFIYPLSSNRDRYSYHIGGIVASSLFLIDYFNGGILWHVFTNPKDEMLIGWFEFLATLNASLIVIWVLLLINFRTIVNVLPEITGNIIFWGFVVGLIYFVLFPIFDGVIYGNYSDEIASFLKPIVQN